MKYLAILTAIALSLTAMSPAEAQDKTRDESPVSIRQIHNPGIDYNRAILNFGLDYMLTLRPKDIPKSTGQTGNTASITMTGSNNLAGINQAGTGNRAFIQIGASDSPVIGNNTSVQQSGNQLFSITNVQGNRNDFSFEQQGQNVGSAILLRGDYMQFQAAQNGSNFMLKPIGSTIPLINISTTRQVLPLIISN